MEILSEVVPSVLDPLVMTTEPGEWTVLISVVELVSV